MATRISLIRHGETDWNVSGRWQGHAAVSLNHEGREQASLLADYLLPIADEITAIYTSDSARTRQTADIVALRLKKPVFPDARWREIDLGEWQGMTVEEVEKWDPDRLHIVRSDSFNTRRPGGESFSDVAARATESLFDLAERHQDEHILIVSHGGTIRSVLIQLELTEGLSATVGNTSLTVLLHGPGDSAENAGQNVDQNGAAEHVWKLDVFNLMDHLGPIRISGQEG